MSNKTNELDSLLKDSAAKVEKDIEPLLVHEQTHVANAMRLHRTQVIDGRNPSFTSLFSLFRTNYLLPGAIATLVLIFVLQTRQLKQGSEFHNQSQGDAESLQYSLLSNDDYYSLDLDEDYSEDSLAEEVGYSGEYEWTEEDMQIDLAEMQIPLYLDDDDFDSDDA